MRSGADVRSLDELREFHAALCTFRTDAMESLSSVDLSIRHLADWISDQTQHWHAAIRKSEEEVFQAKQELAMRKYVGFDGRVPDTTVQEENLQKAKRRLAHAQDKYETCRKWQQRYPHQVGELYEGPARQLSGALEAEVPRALAVLERRIMALEAYAAIPTPAAAANIAEPSAQPPPQAPPEASS
jgi:hypothetical protein